MGRPTSANPRKSTVVHSPELRGLLVFLATERGLADNSVHAYRRDLEDLERFLTPRDRALLTAGVDDYRAYLQGQSRLGQSTRTVTRRLAAIRVFLRYQQSLGQDTSAILEQLDRPKPERSLPMVLSKAHVLQLINTPDPNSPLFFRDIAILEMLYAAGLRASELCDLTLANLNLSVECVRVLGKGKKERIVPIGRAAVEAMERYLAECRPKLDRRGCDRVFLSRTGRPLERIALWMLVEKIVRKSGLLAHVSPHVFRHCFATHLLGGGADLRVVQELLGHSDVATTQIYTHVDQSRLKAIHEKFHPRG
ncbi:MAG: tyrosine recombinase [Tepidisphaeraceae bacterium]|jgi:integrase/recombinase XerD